MFSQYNKGYKLTESQLNLIHPYLQKAKIAKIPPTPINSTSVVFSKDFSSGVLPDGGQNIDNGSTTEQHNYSYADTKVTKGNYVYRLKQIDFNGTYRYSKEVEMSVKTPITFNLNQNYPNPFNPATMISYSIPEKGIVNLSIYNSLGQKVMTLVNGNVDAGNYNVQLNASRLVSGVYFYRLSAGNHVSVKKMMVLK